MQSAVIVEGHPVHDRLLCLLSGGEAISMNAGRFQAPPEAFCRALSQQFPLRLMDERTFHFASAVWNSWLQY